MPNDKTPATPIELKHLHVERIGNDCYSAEEWSLKSTADAKKFTVEARRPLFEKEVYTVAVEHVKEWHRNYVGPNWLRSMPQ